MNPSNAARERLAKRMARLVAEATRAGVVVIADSDMDAVRFLTRAEYRGCDDAAGMGISVDVHDSQRTSRLVSACNREADDDS